MLRVAPAPPWLWLTAATAGMVLLAFIGRPRTAGTVVCSGTTRETARCVFQDALVSNGTVHFYAGEGTSEPETLPPLLCSVANVPAEFTADCIVRAVRDRKQWDALVAGAEDVESGVLLRRLNPDNLYHAVFDQLVPALAMDADPGGGSWTSARPPFALFVADSDVFGAGHLDERVAASLLPRVRFVHRTAGRFRVGRLVVGTKAACTHWGHCLGPGGAGVRTFEPPDAAVRARSQIFANLGIPDLTAVPAPRVHPRITVVQRKGTRGFAPHALAAINATLARIGGRPPDIVDLAAMDLPSQVRLAARTDMLVLVHGAAILHAMFLPPLSVLIDVTPYPTLVEHNPLVTFMRGALHPWLPLGHFPFQIRGPEGQSTVLGPMRANCSCAAPWCEMHAFWNADRVAPDPGDFARHAAEAADAWRRADFPLPRTLDEAHRWAADMKAANGPPDPAAPQCWTKEDEKAKEGR